MWGVLVVLGDVQRTQGGGTAGSLDSGACYLTRWTSFSSPAASSARTYLEGPSSIPMHPPPHNIVLLELRCALKVLRFPRNRLRYQQEYASHSPHTHCSFLSVRWHRVYSPVFSYASHLPQVSGSPRADRVHRGPLPNHRLASSRDGHPGVDPSYIGGLHSVDSDSAIAPFRHPHSNVSDSPIATAWRPWRTLSNHPIVVASRGPLH